MTVDSEAKKILAGGRWAENGDRIDPDSATIDPTLTRTIGWPSTFSASDGETPRRRVFNQRFRELDGFAYDVMRNGILAYDAEINYLQNATVRVDDVLYRALVANGPATNNVTNPTAAANTVWTIVRGEFRLASWATGFADGGMRATTPRSGVLDWFWVCPLDGGRRITGFDFQWRLSGAANWIDLLPRPTSTYAQLTGLVNGTAYEARVRAETSEGDGAWSTPVSATPQGQEPGGGASFALRAEAGNSQVTLDWLEPDDNGATITTYNLQWRSATQTFSTGRQVDLAFGVVRRTLSTGINNGTQYFFRIRAVNTRGNGPWSNEASATPTAPPQVIFQPARASAPTGQAGNQEATWIASPPLDRGAAITQYRWRWRRVGTTDWSSDIVTSIPQLRRTSLTNGVAYEAQVRATNSIGTQATWSPSSSVTPVAEVPDQLQRVFVINTTTGIQISWGEPEDNGAAITGYRVELAIVNTFPGPRAFTPGSTARDQIVNTGLVEGTVYYVRARAMNSRGNAPWSEIVQITHDLVILADPPDAPNAPDGDS